MRRLTTIVAFAAVALLVLAPVASAQTMQLSGDLNALNDSGAQARATLSLEGTSLTVDVEGSGFAPNAPHAQHIHGELGQPSACPTMDADSDGDGFVSTAEGVPTYGGIQQSLTVEGDTSPDSGLAVDRFPVADAEGNLSYTRTFEIPQGVADDLANLHVVVHGIDIDGSGTYDGDKPSSLDPNLPFEATVPAVCGTLAAAPSGVIDTGYGGAATDVTDTDQTTGLWLAAATGLGVLATPFLARRRAATARTITETSANRGEAGS